MGMWKRRIVCAGLFWGFTTTFYRIPGLKSNSRIQHARNGLIVLGMKAGLDNEMNIELCPKNLGLFIPSCSVIVEPDAKASVLVRA